MEIVEKKNNKAKVFNDLCDFLRLHEIKGEGSQITHTFVGNTFGTSGKFEILDNNDIETFHELYKNVLENGIPINLSERQKTIGPLMADFDFNFEADKTDRQYTNKNLINITKHLLILLNDMFENDGNDFIAIISEKPKPSVMKKDGKIIKIKDGFHILIKNSFTINQRKLIYNSFLKIIQEKKLFENIPCTNDVTSIFDEATMWRNNIMMYGSRKIINGVMSQKYDISFTLHYDENGKLIKETFGEKNKETFDKKNKETFDKKNKETFDEKNKETFDVLDTIKQLSVRQYDECDTSVIMKLKDEYKEKMDEIVKESRKKISIKTNKNNNSKVTDEINTIKALTKMFSKERSIERDSWITVCWALHNLSCTYGNEQLFYEDFIEFSKKAEKKFDKVGCDKQWNIAKENKYSIGTIYWWAMEDNLEQYEKYMLEKLNPKFSKLTSKLNMEVAEILYSVCGQCHKFDVDDNKEHFGWYVFNGHRWNRDKKGCKLIEFILNSFCEMLSNFAGTCVSILAKTKIIDSSETKLQIEDAKKKTDDILKVVMKLKDITYLNKLLSACELTKFNDSEFFKKLNSKVNLIGFNNGVYDLDEDKFRDGLPDDCISFSTGYDWVDFNEDDNIIVELKKFLSHIITNEKIREYLLTMLASYFNGANKYQLFSMWTGSGCHSANTKILMYDGQIKCAKDVKMGDLLMGDDSTPRIVKCLYSGSQDMYEITLSDGSKYIGNANHRMALKSQYNGDIYYDDNSKTYIVTYHKYENNIPKKYVKCFGITLESKNVMESIAQDYLNEKLKESSTIKKDMIIPVTILDYLNLSEDVKQHYYHYRNSIEFEYQTILIDAYTMGLNMKTNEIPTRYKFNSKQIRKQLLAGILDKLGYLDNNVLSIKIDHNKLYNDVVFLCRSIGLHVEQIGNNIMQLYGDVGDIPTKKLHLNNVHTEHTLMYEFNVKSLGIGKFYGFSVDKNQRYVLDNLIITYNSNGKSSLITLVKNTFGDYYDSADTSLLTKKKSSASNATPELANKLGKRLVVMQEPEEDDKIQAGSMKSLSGGDTIVSRPLYKDEVKYVPQFKLVLVCNNLPVITVSDGGTWRRIKVIPFDSEFVEKLSKPSKPNQFLIDKKVEEKIKTWHQAFAWLLLKKYYVMYKNNNFTFKEPEEVQMSTKEYQNDSNYLNEFISESYETTKSQNDKISFADFMEKLRAWYKSKYSMVLQVRPNIVKTNLKKMGVPTIIGSDVVFIKEKYVKELNDLKANMKEYYQQ